MSFFRKRSIKAFCIYCLTKFIKLFISQDTLKYKYAIEYVCHGFESGLQMMMKNLISGTHKGVNPQEAARGYESQKIKGSPRTKVEASTIPSKPKDEKLVHVQEEMKPVKGVQGTPPADDVQAVSADGNSRHISIAPNTETTCNPRVNESAT
jgi:hypothetical protein